MLARGQMAEANKFANSICEMLIFTPFNLLHYTQGWEIWITNIYDFYSLIMTYSNKLYFLTGNFHKVQFLSETCGLWNDLSAALTNFIIYMKPEVQHVLFCFSTASETAFAQETKTST